MYRREAPARVRFGLRRELLPAAIQYYDSHGLPLLGRGAWRTGLCPFHEDTHPSLRVHVESGAFRCMACGAHGRDIIDFHRQRYGLSFKEACNDLGAWQVSS